MVKIQQLVIEISSFPKVLYKRGDLKNFSKFTDKQKKQSTRGVLRNNVLKNFAIFTDKHLSQSVFFNKATVWKPETVRSSQWRCFVEKGVFKMVQLCFRTSLSQIIYKNRCSWIIHQIHNKKSVLESLVNKFTVLRTCNFIKDDSDTGDFL